MNITVILEEHNATKISSVELIQAYVTQTKHLATVIGPASQRNTIEQCGAY